MSSSYSLKISSNHTNIDDINNVLSISPTSTEYSWEYSIDEHSDLYADAISYILNLLEGKIELLKEAGVEEDDISIWFLYEYENQCNMEFLPGDLKRIGALGITLCISCWEKDSSIVFDSL